MKFGFYFSLMMSESANWLNSLNFT